MDNYSITTINEVENQLRHILSVKGTELSYPINKNLLKIKRAMTPIQEEAKDFDEMHYMKDENGEKIKFLAEVVENRMSVFVKDADNKFIPESKDRKLEPAQYWVERIDSQNKEYQKGVKELNGKVVAIDWYKFNTEDFEKAKKLLDGIDYTTLLEVGLVD